MMNDDTVNRVYKRKNSKTPLSPTALADEALLLGGWVKATPDDYPARISGSHCACNGNGEFILLPPGDLRVREGGKRYMQCRKCGEWSHL